MEWRHSMPAFNNVHRCSSLEERENSSGDACSGGKARKESQNYKRVTLLQAYASRYKLMAARTVAARNVQSRAA